MQKNQVIERIIFQQNVAINERINSVQKISQQYWDT